MEYYRVNFQMSHHYKVDLEYMDNLIPFERDLYIQMLITQVEKDNAKA